MMQLENGVSWTDVLDRQLTMVKRALKRDTGPEARAKEFNPEEVPQDVWETRTTCTGCPIRELHGLTLGRLFGCSGAWNLSTSA